MPVILNPAGRDVYDRVQNLIDGYYPDLQECQLTLLILIAEPGADDDLERPVLKEAGFPVDATIKPTDYEARTGGLPDVKLKLAGPAWANYSEAERMYTLDSQLYRLVVQREKPKKPRPGQPPHSGPLAILTDDRGRPKLKLKPYDHQVRSYDAMYRRHGDAALDARSVQELSLHYRTLEQP